MAEVALQYNANARIWRGVAGLVLDHRCLFWFLKSQASLMVLVVLSWSCSASQRNGGRHEIWRSCWLGGACQ